MKKLRNKLLMSFRMSLGGNALVGNKTAMNLLIFLILLLPATVQTAENQSIIFSGSYSLDNITTDADSAWLYIFNNATLVDSVKVTAQDLQWDGCYQYAHICTNDSTDGWTGWWVYLGESETVQISEWAIVATARDSSYALHAQVDSLKDTTEALSSNVSSQAQVDSVFDTLTALSSNAPSQAQVDSLSDTLHVLMHTSDTNTAWSVFADLDSVNNAITDANKPNFHSSGDTNAVQGATDTDLDSVLQAIADANKPNFHSDGDTNQVQGSTDTDLDSVLQAIADANKPNFQSDGDTNTNPFDNASDKVTLVDSSADGIHDAEIAALDGLDSANVIHQKLFAQGLADSSSGATDTEIRAALGDSLYSERMDSLVTLLIGVEGRVLDLVYYWGACDDCYYRLYPEGGSANKDSAIIIDPSLGADSLVGKVLYLHGTAPTVVDSAYFYRDEPW